MDIKRSVTISDDSVIVLKFGPGYTSSAYRGVIVADVVAERESQTDEHGYTPEHDDEHGTNHLVTEVIYRLTHMGETPGPDMVYQTFAEGAAMLIAAMEVVVRQQQEERK